MINDRLLGIFLSLLCIGLYANKPNIIFLFSDDHSYEAVGVMGNEEISTPTLDSLAKSGVNFSRTYYQGGACSPSRAQLFSGRFRWNAHKLMVQGKMEAERSAGRHWVETLKNNGYHTFATGKWSDAGTYSKAFDEYPNVVNKGYHVPTGGDVKNFPNNTSDTRFSPYDKSKGGFWKSGGIHLSERTANDAVQFINSRKSKSDPFFMYVAFNAPHDPRQAPKEYVDKYPWQNISVPKSFKSLYTYHNELGLTSSQRDEALAPFPRTEYAVKVHRSHYYAMIEHMDAQIKRILDALKGTIHESNTYVIYTSDNGLALGHHGIISKFSMYDHSIRVPMFLSGPNVPVDSVIHSPVYLHDMVPTTMELAGITKPSYVEFESLVPLIKNEVSNVHSSVYSVFPAQGEYLTSFHSEQSAVVMGNYKMTFYRELEHCQLFDLKEDPDEKINLCSQEKYSLIAFRLWEEMLKQERAVGTDEVLTYDFPVPDSSQAGCLEEGDVSYSDIFKIHDPDKCQGKASSGVSLRKTIGVTWNRGQIRVVSSGEHKIRMTDTKGNVMFKSTGYGNRWHSPNNIKQGAVYIVEVTSGKNKLVKRVTAL